MDIFLIILMIILVILIYGMIILINAYKNLDNTNFKNFQFALKLYEENCQLKKEKKNKYPKSLYKPF